MEYFRVILLVTLTTICSGLELGIYEDKMQMVKPGSSKNLTCHVDMGLGVILEYQVEWIHVSLANPAQPEETKLTRHQTLQNEASPDYFGIDVDYDSKNCNFTLIIKKVSSSSDGVYKCKATPIKDLSRDIVEQEVRIIVVNDVQSIAMEFDGEESITGEDSVGLQREEGEYGVTCAAKGFNPDAISLNMYLGEEKLDTTDSVVLDLKASESAEAPRYSAVASATSVHLLARHSGLTLTCEAQADFVGAQTLVASVPLTIIILEPVIFCEETNATLGDSHVKITCRVQHDNVLIERYSWEIGDTGEIIVPGGFSDNLHEVIVKEIDAITTDVTLDLFKVDEMHFDTLYYLDVFTEKDQRFRVSTELKKRDDSPSSATRDTAMFLSCALCVLFSFFSR